MLACVLTEKLFILIRKQYERIVEERVCYCHPAIGACYSENYRLKMLAHTYGHHLQTHISLIFNSRNVHGIKHHTRTPIDLSECSIMSNHPDCLIYSMDDGLFGLEVT